MMDNKFTLTDDEVRLLTEYRQSKKMVHARGRIEMEWDVKNGAMVKLWVTNKIDLDQKPGIQTLREGQP